MPLNSLRSRVKDRLHSRNKAAWAQGQDTEVDDTLSYMSDESLTLTAVSGALSWRVLVQQICSDSQLLRCCLLNDSWAAIAKARHLPQILQLWQETTPWTTWQGTQTLLAFVTSALLCTLLEGCSPKTITASATRECCVELQNSMLSQCEN